MNPYASQTANKYKSLEVNSSNRLKVVVMIYDAAIASLKHAVLCHRKNDLVKRNQFISRTQFIVQELNNALDLRNGRDIASSLRKIYFFVNRYLSELINDNDIRKAERVLTILTKLREAWEEISNKAIMDERTVTSADVYHGRGPVRIENQA